MIVRLTPKTAALVGETPAEWELLETQVRTGPWTSGPRTDAGRLRALAAELGVAVRDASGPTEASKRGFERSSPPGPCLGNCSAVCRPFHPLGRCRS